MSVQKKILFINSPGPYFLKFLENHIPLGPLYLGASLINNGFIVKYVDIHNDEVNMEKKGNSFSIKNYFESKLKNILSSFEPDFICMSIHFAGRFKPAQEMCGLIKKFNSSLPIIIGGIHPTMFGKDILSNCAEFDFVLKGEAEYTLVKFLNSFFSDATELSNIDGLVFRDSSGNIVENPKNDFIDDIDELPLPAYNLINMEDYYFDTSKWQNPKNVTIDVPIHLITSRSCPLGCFFCPLYQLNGKKYRVRSPKNVVDEIEWIYKEYGRQYFSIMDDNFSLNKNRTIEIAKDILKRKLNIHFELPHGMYIENIDEEMVENLTAAGWIRASLGVETGSEYLRTKIMKKHKLTNAKIYEVFDILKKYKQLRINACFVLGLPQETKETLKDTFDMIKKLELKNLALHVATPFPGTELYSYCKQNKLFVNEIPENELYKSDTFYWYSPKPSIKPHNLEIDDIVKFREEVYAYIKSVDKGSIAYRNNNEDDNDEKNKI